MENSHSGSCLCGKVCFEIDGQFQSFFLCHCKYCQKDTGSAHAANLFSSSSKIIWNSGEQRVKTFQLPGTKHIKSFCSICGSALPSFQSELGAVVVPAGSLDTPLKRKPNAHLFMTSKASWEADLQAIPSFDELP
jgi:hypothetical protein